MIDRLLALPLRVINVILGGLVGALRRINP